MQIIKQLSMLAFIEITLNPFFLLAIVLLSGAAGFFINRKQLRQQKARVSMLEKEMLQSHSEILQLQKELSDKEHEQSQTPIFSIHDNAAEPADEKLAAARLSKKMGAGGGNKSGS